MPTFKGAGGAIFEIDEPDAGMATERFVESLNKGELAPFDDEAQRLANKLLGVEPEPEPEPEPKKPAAKKAAAPKGEE